MATIRRSGVPLQYHNAGSCSKCTFALIENLPSEAAAWLSLLALGGPSRRLFHVSN